MSKNPCATASATQKNLISLNRDCRRLTVLFVIPTAVELSQCMGVGGCGCPISSRVSQQMVACLQLRNRAPSSDSAAEATTKRKIVHSVKNAPFNLIGFVGSGFHPMKKWPHALLCGLAFDKCDSSKWMFITISNA